VHILRGEYPVKPGLIVGHEPVGRVEAVGVGVTGFEAGDRYNGQYVFVAPDTHTVFVRFGEGYGDVDWTLLFPLNPGEALVCGRGFLLHAAIDPKRAGGPP